MPENKIIQQGAEAIIALEGNSIHKKRIKKSYRYSDLDKKLRKSRTKSETKIIKKLNNIIPVPKVLDSDDKENITMEYVNGKKLSDNLEKLDWNNICKLIGNNITKIHNSDIIHGDLTTSNMIFKNNLVYFIDFGLAFHSYKIEDKAVDLHLLKQALDAKHFTISEKAFDIMIKNYKPKKRKEILDRIKVIESRGRYKDKH